MNKKEDPSEVVIDEVVGQMIAYMMPIIITLYYFTFIHNIEFSNNISIFVISIALIILPFIFFRIFDILKPGLVGYFDKNVKGAIGVIMDDVVAGIYAGIVVSFTLILFFVSIGYY